MGVLAAATVCENLACQHCATDIRFVPSQALRIMNWQDHITADPAVLVGKPVIRGTRLAVEFILGLVAQGWPEDEITRNDQLTREQVRACAALAQPRMNEEKVFAHAV
jgi:uncharacterized protein (DUF433 family)